MADRSDNDDGSDSDTELEDVITTALLENGKQKLAAGDLEGAAKVFKKCSARLSSIPTSRNSERNTKTLLKSLEVAENLLTISQQLERWSDVQGTLTQKIRLKKNLGQKESASYVEDLIALARVSQRLEHLVEAQSWARKGLKHAKRLHRSDHIKSCLGLLIELCKATENDGDEEAYTVGLAELDEDASEISGEKFTSNPASFQETENVIEDDKGGTPDAALSQVRTHVQSSDDDPKHDFLDINFDEQISTWSVALDRVFGTRGTTDEDEPNAGLVTDFGRSSDILSALSSPDHGPFGSTSERAPHNDSNSLRTSLGPVGQDDTASISSSGSLSDQSSPGTVHMGIPTRLSHARASLVGSDSQMTPTRPGNGHSNDPDQLQPSTEHNTPQIMAQEDKERQQTKPDSDLKHDVPLHDSLTTTRDTSPPDNPETEMPDPFQVTVEQESPQVFAKAGSGVNRVDSVRPRDNASMPAALARKNSWTQADIDHEDSLGAYKQVSLESEGPSRARASTLQPNPTDAWEEKKAVQRSLARRNGKRASRVSRALTARPVLEQTVPECLELLAESARCGLSTPQPAGNQREHSSDSKSALNSSACASRSHAVYQARMSVDDWQERQTKQRLWTHVDDVDDASALYSTSDDADDQTRSTTSTVHEQEPIRRYSSAFTIEAGPQYGPTNHEAARKPAAKLSQPGVSKPTADESSERLNRDHTSLIRRTLTSASKVSYATTMSKASSADSSTTIKPNKEKSLSPVISPPTSPPKLVLIGDPLCGKTAIARRFAYDDFYEGWGGIGAYNYDMAVTTDRPGQTIQIDFWDTAGQEEFFPLRQLAYDRPQCILICFAIDSRDSFDNIAHAWLPEVFEHCRGVPILLVGCKADLRKSQLATAFTERLEPALVDREQGVKMATSIGAEKYLECSAKDNDSVVEVFEAAIRLGLARCMKKRRKRKSILNLFSSS